VTSEARYKWLMRFVRSALAMALLVWPAFAQEGNKPERLEWFRDLGFGLFIHWSFDSQLGVVISHSMVGASDDYLKRFVEDLPKTYNPRKFNPQDWAALAKLAGVKYVVFTTKHHSGFTMFPSATTDFNIMNTPFHRDATGEVLKAFREQGIAPGIYFSPDDFWWLYKNGKTIQRNVPDVQPANNPGLMQHDQAQVREILTNYGPIDIAFFDGEPQGLKELAWQLNPDIVVTRGAIQTPEQYVPGVPIEGAWESCITMGTAWQYQPRNENYKSGGQLISLLVETRAKGGNLLLNVGPKPDGELAIEQEERLRELALWMFVNSEAIYGVRPWVITNEQDLWITRKKDADTIYVVVKEKEPWKRGAWKDIVLHSVKSSAETQVSVLGQNDKILEYRDVVPKTTWKQEADGLHIRAMHAQRLQDNSKWPNPVVLKVTGVKPALKPPQVMTTSAKWNGGTATFSGELKEMGSASSLEVGFEYRLMGAGLDINERNAAWTATPMVKRGAPGAFSTPVSFLKAGQTYEYRAVVKHPLLSLYGAERKLSTK
jgi:alpha-L-fucosidase